jgi:hypothetical protein
MEKHTNEACYVAITYEQHPLTGDAVPTVKRITRDTTVGDLADWYKEVFPQSPSMWDIRITEAT